MSVRDQGGRVRCALVTCAMVLLTCALSPAVAQAEPSRADKAQAAKRFREAEALYKKSEFRRAAELFEEAFVLAPHPDALLNAIDAYEKAGDLALAAEICARLLREDDGAASKVAAERRLERLAPKIGRLRIVVVGKADSVAVNGSPASEGDRWVEPGTHHVEARFGDKTVALQVEASAGQVTEVKLDPAPPPPPPPKEQEPSTGGWDRPLHPGFFFAGLGLTIVSGSVMIWSGVDTNSARDEFDLQPTQSGLDDGQGKQTRTNVFVATTVILGAATGLIGAFAVDWSFGADDAAADGAPKNDVSLALSLSAQGATLRGAF